MSRAVLVDSGPLYVQVDRDDEHHLQARDEMTEVARGGWLITAIVPTIQETHRLILYRLGRHVASIWISEINRRATIVAPARADYDLACARLAQYPDQDITLADALLATMSLHRQVPVWTYDHHFDILGAQRWFPGQR